jgi:hypothetical protein
MEKISWADLMRNELFLIVKGEKNILHKIRLKATWNGHVCLRNCILKHVNEGKIEVTGVLEGRRRKAGSTNACYVITRNTKHDTNLL